MIYLLTAIELSPGGSSTVHIYTQTIHRTTQITTKQTVSRPVWHIPLLCIQRKTPDNGQRNLPKHVDFYSKNKFEKLVHLVGFIIRIWGGIGPTWAVLLQKEIQERNRHWKWKQCIESVHRSKIKMEDITFLKIRSFFSISSHR
jgi:hypothetical protein